MNENCQVGVNLACSKVGIEGTALLVGGLVRALEVSQIDC